MKSGYFRTLAVAALVSTLASCSSNGGDPSGRSSTSRPPATEVTLLAHNAFVMPPGMAALFKKETGISVKILQDGDAGALLNKAILTRGKPQADVMFGVDNAFLSRAIDEKVFAPGAYRALDTIDAEHRDQFGNALRFVVPVDYGDVCINYDKAWFAQRKLAPPTNLDDLTDPKYSGLTVVQNPASSSPGLAFLIATRDRHPGASWKKYWQALQRNKVLVVQDWTVAFQTEFTAGGGDGTRPIMISYASSPPADVFYSQGAKTKPSIVAVEDGCVRQYEFVGVLAGSPHETEGRRLVEFMLSGEFQRELPLSNFVFPVRRDIALPKVFSDFALSPSHPITFDYIALGRDRAEWIREWTELVLG